MEEMFLKKVSHELTDSLFCLAFYTNGKSKKSKLNGNNCSLFTKTEETPHI